MSDAPETATIKLVHPIRREGGDIADLVLRKPKAGDLRRLSLQKLLESDIDTLLSVIPRISEPALIDSEVAQLEAEDFAEIGGTIFGFFMSPTVKKQVEEMTAR